MPKDLKLNFNPEITKVRSAEVKTISDEEKFIEDETSHGGYYQSKTPSMSRSDIKLPPRNVLYNETFPQPLLPPVSPQRSGAISLPSRYTYKLTGKF